MKKILSLFLATSFLLAGCSGEKKESASAESSKADDKKRIVMITDKGTIDDRSFNENTYHGVKAFDEKNSTYIKPQVENTSGYLKSIELAVQKGAEVIVTPGFLFEEAIYEAQEKYPNLKFILVDGVPTKDGQSKIGANTTSILYNEHESGFLAGYAAVKDGYRELGFMGGIAVPAVVKFGQGFIQGATEAAQELKVQVNVKYTYLGSFGPKPEYKTKALSWYNSGTEVIFVAAGGAGNSVMAAAADMKKAVIGVDVDQSNLSETVITSATKNLSGAVQETLKKWQEGKFPGGEKQVLGLKEGMVGLPLETSKFKNFTKEDYEKIVNSNKEVKFDLENQNFLMDGVPGVIKVEFLR